MLQIFYCNILFFRLLGDGMKLLFSVLLQEVFKSWQIFLHYLRPVIGKQTLWNVLWYDPMIEENVCYVCTCCL